MVGFHAGTSHIIFRIIPNHGDHGTVRGRFTRPICTVKAICFNVKVQVLGDYSTLPKDAVKSLEKTLEETKNNTGLQFNIALNYGGRDEIRRSVQTLAEKVAQGALQPEEITEDMIGAELFTGSSHADSPDPELIIRTSGEERLSNFLLWQSAYSELVFADALWPDFTPEEYEKAIEEYQSRDRRFGGR